MIDKSSQAEEDAAAVEEMTTEPGFLEKRIPAYNRKY